MKNNEINEIRYQKTLAAITGFISKYLYLLLAAIVMFTFVGLDFDNWQYNYSDSDGYMRAIKVYSFVTNPSFFEQPIWQSNYPFGEVLHWTRGFDILWLIVSLPFLFVLDLKDAIFVSGAFISPLLLIPTVIMLAYGIRRHFNIYLTILGCLFFLSNSLIMTYFNATRPDHHSVMACLLAASFSFILAYLKDDDNRHLKYMAICLAFMTYTAIEGFLFYIIVLCYFAFMYIFYDKELKLLQYIAKCFAIVLSILWVLNPPYEGYLYPDNGRISVFYVCASWLVYFSFMAMKIYKGKNSYMKIHFLGLFAILSLFVLLIVFGFDVFTFPLIEGIKTIWADRIHEMKPITEYNFTKILGVFGFATIAIGLNVHQLFKGENVNILVLNLFFSLPIYVLTMMALRFNNYQFIYVILPFLCLINNKYQQTEFAKTNKGDFPEFIWAWCIGLLFLQHLFLIPITVLDAKKSGVYYSPMLCSNVSNIGGTLVTDIFLSPKYMWNCGVNTISTPYHRNIEGIIDGHNILFGTDRNEVLRLIKKHQVTQILLFNEYSDFYDLSYDNKYKLYYRLLKEENLPDYIIQMPIVLKNAVHYRINLE